MSEGIFVGGFVFIAEVTPVARVMPSEKVGDVNAIPLGPYCNGSGGEAISQFKAMGWRVLVMCRSAYWCGGGKFSSEAAACVRCSGYHTRDVVRRIGCRKALNLCLLLKRRGFGSFEGRDRSGVRMTRSVHHAPPHSLDLDLLSLNSQSGEPNLSLWVGVGSPLC